MCRAGDLDDCGLQSQVDGRPLGLGHDRFVQSPAPSFDCNHKVATDDEDCKAEAFDIGCMCRDWGRARGCLGFSRIGEILELGPGLSGESHFRRFLYSGEAS